MQIVEYFTGDDTREHLALSLQQTQIVCAEGSHCAYYRLNTLPATCRQVSSVATQLNYNARFNAFFGSLGGKLDRTDINLYCQGTNAECEINGVYLPSADRCVDFHTNIEHQKPHCRSEETFRGIIADRAKATFNGKIHIFRDAQKSDAQLSNKNLLLTNQAEVNTKPELEIYADDVKCAHGATVAQLDSKATYYLQTRGIDKETAEKMLSAAFVKQLIADIKLTPFKTRVESLINDYMNHLK